MNRLLFGIIAAAAVAGCAGGPQEPVICNAAAIPLFKVVYPAPSATNVPDSISSLVFAGSPLTGTGDTADVELSVGGTEFATIGTFGAAPSPLPTPDASPLPAPPYVGVPVPSLSARTTYTVTYQYTIAGSGECAGTVDIAQGSFTTQ